MGRDGNVANEHVKKTRNFVVKKDKLRKCLEFAISKRPRRVSGWHYFQRSDTDGISKIRGILDGVLGNKLLS